MGCACSKSLQEVDHETAQIRAAHSSGAYAGPTSAAFLQPARLQAAAADGRSRRISSASSNAAFSTSGSSTGLSRTQWKQVRSLLRSNLNPHYHQIQQLQVLPATRLQQAQLHAVQRLRPDARGALHDAIAAASTAAASATAQHLHHHHHHHSSSSSSRHHHRDQLLVQHLSAGGSLAGFSSSSPARQLASVQSAPASVGSAAIPSVLQPFNSSGSSSLQHLGLSHSSRTGLSSAAAAAADALTAGQLLALCGAVVDENAALAAAGVQPILLASLCLVESGGCAHAKQYRDHLGDVALGLCQMLLSTAQWLAATKGFDRYGTCPSAALLEQPKACVYYAAAYLSILAQHNGCRRGEAFIVKAYHTGPKGVNSAAAALYWQKYAKARFCMRQVARCMADTLAAAAVAAGLPLGPQAAAAAAANSLGSRSNSRAMSNSQQQQHGEDRGSSSEEQQPELQVWVRAANLIAALSSTWEPEAAAAGAGQAAAEAAAASSAASLMLHIFPHWSSNKVQQQQQQQQQQQLSLPPPAPQQQQQQQQIAGSSGSGSGVGLLRRWRSGGAAAAAGSTAEGGGGSRGAGSSSSSSTRISPAAAGSAMAASSYGALALVSVTCSAFAAALQRLSCIDHAATETALSNAAARAAAAAASAAAEERRRARLGQPSSRDNAADGRTAALQALPCVMHVIGHGESLASIAAICGVSIPDILAANPDLPAADIMPIVQASDCIALPVPAIPPCLHVVQHGDTLHGIARMYRVPLGRLIAKNPELADPSRVQQGWVVVLPGLKGDSKSGAAMEWLAEAAVAAAAPEPDSSDAAGPEAAPAAVVGAAEGSSGTQPRDVEPQQHIRQDQAVASEPAAAAAAAAGFSLQEDDTAPSGLDSSGSSPIASWAHVGWRKPAAAPAAAAGAADVAAASLLPAVGSGAFMFAVGQASESCAECIPAGNHVQLRMSAVQQHHSHPGKSGRASSWPGSRSTAAAAAAGHSLLRAP